MWQELNTSFSQFVPKHWCWWLLTGVCSRIWALCLPFWTKSCWNISRCLGKVQAEAMLWLTWKGMESGTAAANWNFSLPSNTEDRLPNIFPQLIFIVYTRNCQPWFYALLCWMMGRGKGLPKEKDSKSRENELDTSSYSKSISALLLSSCKVLHAALNDDTLALGENTKKHSRMTQNISDS